MSWKNPFTFIIFVACIFIARQYIKTPEIPQENFRKLQALTNTSISISPACQLELSTYSDQTNQSIPTGSTPSLAMQQYLAGNITLSNYTGSLLKYAIPWIIMAVLSGLGFLCFLSASICVPSLCCIKTKYTQAEEKCCMVPLVVFSLGAFVVSSVGLIANSLFNSGVQNLSCQVEAGFITLINGQETSQISWAGLTNISTQLQALSNGLYEYSIISYGFISNASFLNNINQYYESIDEISSDYSDKTVPNPNPFSTQGDLNIPLFEDLGTADTQNTSTYNMTLDFTNNQQEWVYYLTNLSSIVSPVATNTTYFNSTISNAVDDILNLTSNLNNLLKNILNITQEIRTSTQSFNNTVFTILLLILILVLSTIIFGVILSCYNKSFFKIILHIIWIALQLAAIIIFILITFLVEFSYISTEACGVMNEMISDPSGYQQYANILNFSFFSQTENCIFGDGNITESFEIQNSLFMLNNISQSLSLINEIQQDALNTNINPDNVTLLQNQVSNVINTYMSNPPDSACLTNDSDCIINQMKYINSWADYSIGTNQSYYCPSMITEDDWVLNGACLSNYTYTINNNDSTQYTGYPTCVNPFDFNTSSISNRYNDDLFSDCLNNFTYTLPSGEQIMDVNQMIITYWANINNYQTSLIQDFTNLNNDLNDYIVDLSNLNMNFYNLAVNLSQNQSIIQNISEMITDPQIGFIDNSDCSFVGSYINQTYYDFCGNVVPSILLLKDVTMLFAFLIWLVSISAFCLTMRYIRTEKNIGNTRDLELSSNNIHKAPYQIVF